MTDPLTILPPEIVLQIIDVLPPSTTAKLSRLSISWYTFIVYAHRDRIYSHPSKVDRPTPQSRVADSNNNKFSFLSDLNCFTKYYDGVHDWKDLCRRQTLLRRNLDSPRPVTCESVFQIGLAKVWRFRPDFRRRFVISTSEFGGVEVTDMDTGRRLWRNSEVRSYAHLEYDADTGTAAWDAFGDIVEVWRVHDDDGGTDGKRGVFRRIERLAHDCQTRGFEIAHGDLSVVSCEGKAFVYDVRSATLKSRISIDDGAVGHLCQDADVVMISMGSKGYHIHSKTTGERLGILDPLRCSNVNHIKHKTGLQHALTYPVGPTLPPLPPGRQKPDRLVPLTIEPGPLERSRNTFVDDLDSDDEDDLEEWGAGLLDGDCMAGISKLGRLFICPDWRRALLRDEYDAAGSQLIECDTNPRVFHLGGWLALREGKVALEVGDCIYLLSVKAPKNEPVWAMLSASDARTLPLPVSFMAMGHDCFMHTFGTPCPLPELGDDILAPMKTIRVVSFAPDLD